MSTDSLATEAQRYGWYHTIDLGDGVVTEGMFDHRPVLERFLIPADLSGMRCLDVGTMDGFWAFEMERRGSTDVLAIDLEDPERLDWPRSFRDKIVKTLDIEKSQRFELAKKALGSKVERELCSVYELGEQFGTFDFVFCGDLLVHLKDPITAVENIRTACRGSATVFTPVESFRLSGDRPLARLDGVDEFNWWVLNSAALVQMMRAAGFSRIERGKEFALPARGGGKWRGVRGIARGYV